MVGHCHELGQGREAEDGVVGQVDRRDVEVDELGPVIGVRPEGDGEADLPYRGGRTISDS